MKKRLLISLVIFFSAFGVAAAVVAIIGSVTNNGSIYARNSLSTQRGIAAIVGIVGALIYWVSSGRKRTP